MSTCTSLLESNMAATRQTLNQTLAGQLSESYNLDQVFRTTATLKKFETYSNPSKVKKLFNQSMALSRENKAEE